MSACDPLKALHSKTREFKEEAANLSKEELISKLRPVFKKNQDFLNRAVILEELNQKKRSGGGRVKEDYLKNGNKTYFNLVWPPIYMERLLEFYPDIKKEQSREWLVTACDNQAEALEQGAPLPSCAAHSKYFSPLDQPPVPTAARGGFGKPSGGSRGAQMTAAATARQPNPSSLAHPGGGGKGGGSLFSSISHKIAGACGVLTGQRGATETRQCTGCEQSFRMADLHEEGGFGFFCRPCKLQNLNNTAALQPPPPKRAKTLQQQQLPVYKNLFGRKNQTVPTSNFGAGYGGGGGGGSTMPQPPKLASGANSLRDVLHTAQGDARARAPPPALGFDVLHPPRQRQHSAKKPPPPSPGDNAEHPIELLDSDEEGRAGAAAVAAAPAAAKQEGRRPPRRAAAAALASVTQRLAGLKCTIPPAGGPGSVEFTASDMARLGPEEFLNDTAIDYYLRWLHLKLEAERPEDARRCYFFNTFFYKKLTEKEGGKLPAWAEGLALKPKEAQALRNYEKVKNWTRKVDIFDKDYVFVPIHDHLHWSLMVICHPAALFAPKLPQRPRKRPSQTSQQEDDEAEDPRLRPEPFAFILHLDSLEGSGHSTPAITKVLQSYLKSEWKTKAEGAADSVPKRWQAARPGEPLRDFSPLISFAPSVPRQDNYCDCGLYVCAFTEYFTFAMPPALNAMAVAHLDRHWRDGIDLWEGDEKGRWYPGFLTKGWFDWPNASNLRWDMAHLVLGHMGVQCELMVGEERHEDYMCDVDTERLEPIVIERQRMTDIMAEKGYLRPEEWRYHGLENKKGRRKRFLDAQKERARKDEEARAQAAAAAVAREQRQQHSKRHIVFDDSDDSDSEDGGGAGGGGATAGAAAPVATAGGAASQDAWRKITGLPDNSQRGIEEDGDIIVSMSIGDEGEPMDEELPPPRSLQPTAAAAAASALFASAQDDLMRVGAHPGEGFGPGEPEGQFFIGGHPYGGTLNLLPASGPSTAGDADLSGLLDPHDPLLGKDVPRGPRTGAQAPLAQHRHQQQRRHLPFEGSFGAQIAQQLSDQERPFGWPAGGPVRPCYEEQIDGGAPPPNLEHATLVVIEKETNNFGEMDWCRLGIEYCAGSSVPFFNSALLGADAFSRIFSDWFPLWAGQLPPGCRFDLPVGCEVPSEKMQQRAREMQQDRIMGRVRRQQQQQYTQEREEEVVEATEELEAGEDEDVDVGSHKQSQWKLQQQSGRERDALAVQSAEEGDDPIEIVDDGPAAHVLRAGPAAALSPGRQRRQDRQLKTGKGPQPLFDNEGPGSPPKRGLIRNRKSHPSRGGGGCGGGGAAPLKTTPRKNAGPRTEKGAALFNLSGKLRGDLAASGKHAPAQDQQRMVKRGKTKAGVGLAAEKKSVDVVDMTDD